MLHQYPFVRVWLTVKVLLLVVYVMLGSLALKRGRSRGTRLACYVYQMIRRATDDVAPDRKESTISRRATVA